MRAPIPVAVIAAFKPFMAREATFPPIPMALRALPNPFDAIVAAFSIRVISFNDLLLDSFALVLVLTACVLR